MADAAGVSRGSMCNVMNGHQSPTLATLEKLAAAFEIPVDRLLTHRSTARPTLPRGQTD